MEPNGWTKTKYDWLKFNNAMCGNIKQMEHTVTVSEDVNGSEWLVPKNRFVPAGLVSSIVWINYAHQCLYTGCHLQNQDY